MYIPLSVTHAMHTQAKAPVWVKAPGDVKWERGLFSRWGGGHFSRRPFNPPRTRYYRKPLWILMRMCSEYKQWELSWKAAACNIHKYLPHAAFSFRIQISVMEGGRPGGTCVKWPKVPLEQWTASPVYPAGRLASTRSHNRPLKTKLKTFRTRHRKEIRSEINE